MKSQHSKPQKTKSTDQNNGILSKFKNSFVSHRSNNLNSNPSNKSVTFSDKNEKQQNNLNKNVYISRFISSNYSEEFLNSFNFTKSEFYNHKLKKMNNQTVPIVLSNYFKHFTPKPSVIENVFMLVVDDYLNYTCEHILSDKIRSIYKRLNIWNKNPIVRPGLKMQIPIPGNITLPDNYTNPEFTVYSQDQQRKTHKIDIIKKANDSLRQSADLNNNVTEKIKQLNANRSQLDYSLSKSQLLDEISEATLTAPTPKPSKNVSKGLINSNTNNCADRNKMNKKYLGIFRKKLHKEHVVNIDVTDSKKSLENSKLHINKIFNIDISPQKSEIQSQTNLKKTKKSMNKSSEFIYNPKVRRSVTFHEPRVRYNITQNLRRNPEFLSHTEINSTKFDEELSTIESVKTSRSISPNTTTIPNLSFSTDCNKQSSVQTDQNETCNDELSTKTLSGLYYNLNNPYRHRNEKFIFVNKLSHHKPHQNNRSLSPAIVSLRSTTTTTDDQVELTNEKRKSSYRKKSNKSISCDKSENCSIIEVIKPNNEKPRIKFLDDLFETSNDNISINPINNQLDHSSTVCQEIIISDNDTDVDKDCTKIQFLAPNKNKNTIFTKLKTANFASTLLDRPVTNNNFNDTVKPMESIKFIETTNSTMINLENKNTSFYSNLPIPIKSANYPKFDKLNKKYTKPSILTISDVDTPPKASFYQHTLSSQQKVRYKHNQTKKNQFIREPMKFKK